LRTLREFLEEFKVVIVAGSPIDALKIIRVARRYGLNLVVVFREEECPSNVLKVRSQGCEFVFEVTMASAVIEVWGPGRIVMGVDPGTVYVGMVLVVNGVLLATNTYDSLLKVLGLINELRKYLMIKEFRVKVGRSESNPEFSEFIKGGRRMPGVSMYLVSEERASLVSLRMLEGRTGQMSKHEEAALRILLTPLKYCKEVKS